MTRVRLPGRVRISALVSLRVLARRVLLLARRIEKLDHSIRSASGKQQRSSDQRKRPSHAHLSARGPGRTMCCPPEKRQSLRARRRSGAPEKSRATIARASHTTTLSAGLTMSRGCRRGRRRRLIRRRGRRRRLARARVARRSRGGARADRRIARSRGGSARIGVFVTTSGDEHDSQER